MPQRRNETTTSSLVTELFVEYLQERETRRRPDIDALFERAGEKAEDLRTRIDQHESLKDLGANVLHADEEHPETLGRYEKLELIGKGGMGSVYVAHDTLLKRQVALKIVGTPDGVFGERSTLALNEARSLARLEHPGVVKVHEVGRAAGRVFLVMELMSGPSMAQVIEEQSELSSVGWDDPNEPAQDPTVARKLRPLRERLHCLADIARALAFCHDRGVLHRDIKPSNVLFSGNGEPKLIDFGLAHLEDDGDDDDPKLDTSQSFRGTPAYFSPEQVETHRTGADPLSEIFSFGTLCYELISGQQPFRQPTREATLDSVLRARPKPLHQLDASIPVEVERVVQHCLERNPADRYPNLDAAAADLAALLENRPTSVEDPSLARMLHLWAKRHRSRIRLAAGLAIIAAAFLGGTWFAANLVEHKRLRGAISAFEVESLRRPSEFRAAYFQTYRLRNEVERFESGPLRGRIFPDLNQRTDAHIDELSRRLGAVVSQEDPERVLLWMPVVSIDETLNPQNTHNRALRDRGHVEFALDHPDLECALYVQGPAGESGEERAARAYKELDIGPIPSTGVFRLRDLSAGIYRLIAWRPGAELVYGEVEFVLESIWEPLQRLSIRESGADTGERRYEQRTLTYDRRRRAGTIGIWVAAFRVGDVVTNEAYRSFCSSTGRDLPGKVPESGLNDAVTQVSWADASVYAQWSGGRLPTAYELNVIHEPPLTATDESEITGGEWVSDSPPMGGIDLVQFLPNAALGKKPWLHSSHTIPRTVTATTDAGGSVVGFRVVYSADSREDLLRASRPGH